MSELSKKVNRYFNDMTKPELNILLETIMLDEHLHKVLIMRYVENKDIDFIAYKTGYSKGKIEADLRKIRRKIARLIG